MDTRKERTAVCPTERRVFAEREFDVFSIVITVFYSVKSINQPQEPK